MNLSGKYHLHGSPQQVWPLLHDPAVLASLIPGCQGLEQTGPAEYRGAMYIPAPAVAGLYTTYVRLEPAQDGALDDPAGEPHTTRFAGELSGPAGQARGTVLLSIDADGAGSLLTYEGQGGLSGSLARISPRFAEGVAQALIEQGLAGLDARLRSEHRLSPVDAARQPPAPARPARSWPARATLFALRLLAWLQARLRRRTAR